MSDFDKFFERLMGHEGGYVNDPADPGGETKWGISKRCLAPATRVLTAELQWVPCGSLSVGDRLLAFDEKPERHGKLNLRRLRVANVLAVGPVRLQASRITTERRWLVASDDHEWLCRRGLHRVYRWAKTKDLLTPTGRYGRKGTSVAIGRFLEPWTRLESRAAGYLAGVLDGEGCVSGSSIGFTQKDNACLAQAEAAMADLGFVWRRSTLRHDVHDIRFLNPMGRPYFTLEVAGSLGASRLLANLARQLIGKNVASTNGAPESVLAVEPIGEVDLVGIDTSTRTLIVEGLLSHNSYPHLDIKNLTRDEAKEIYRSDFWYAIHASKLHDGVAFQLLDFAINSGVSTAIRAFQRALGVADDGNWGPVSQAAADAMSETDQIMRVLAERLDFMTRLKNWQNHGKGWARRIAGNLRHGAEDS